MSSEEINSLAKTISTQDQVNLVIAEFNALRDEIVKHIEIEHQLLSLALIALGTILTVGFQTKNASLIFLYPVLGMFLSIVWLANFKVVYNLANYIYSRIETHAGQNNIGWESVRKSMPSGWTDKLYSFGSMGILIGSELLALLAGILVANFNIQENTLLVVAIISSIFTIIMSFIFAKT